MNMRYENKNNDSIGIKGQEGYTLIELLVGMLLIAIISMAVMRNTTGALWASKLTEVNHIASSLAISKAEELAAQEAQNIAATATTETNLTHAGSNITFTRTTTVTVNADNSRDIVIVVSSENPNVPTTVTFQTTFVPWG